MLAKQDTIEYREIQRIARARRMSVAEWVREALANVQRSESTIDPGKKLAVIRASARHEYPTGYLRATSIRC